MEKVIIEILGYISATITTIAFLPQIIKTLKTKSAKDVSMGMFVLFTVGVFLWVVYGFLTWTMPDLVANIVIFCLALTQIILKIKYDKLENKRIKK
jgi:MtN3 and saliva related transmembrane protein